ncbi:MAG: hypothetical protein ACXWRA_05020 [Pseudobdellovibrionaceae bacterium]
MKLSTILLVLVATLPLQSFGANKPIKGYPGECTMFLANGNPVIELEFYSSPENAAKSSTSVSSQPIASAILDSGPGYQIVDINAKSKVAQICAEAKQNKGTKKATIETNSQGVLVSMTIDSKTIKSDAYLLMNEDQKALVKSLVTAYLSKDTEAYNCKNPQRAPAQ